MKQLRIPKETKIKAFYIFFIINSLQIGVGFTGYAKFVFVEARQDSWISLIIAMLIVHLVIACMIYILNSYESNDLHGILQQMLGKHVGKFISYLFIFYFFLITLSVLLNFTEIVNVFLFSRINNWVPILMLLLVVIYAVFGGFRVVVGVSFILFFTTILIIILLIEPLKNIDLLNFKPMFEADISEIFSGVVASTYTVLGFEILWFVYPFIADNRNIAKYSHLSVLFTGFLLLLTIITSIGFYSSKQLEVNIWPLFQMFKILSFPIFERFDIIIVALWFFVILPNVVLLVWAITFGLRRVSKFKQKHFLYVVTVILFIAIFFFEERHKIVHFTDTVAKVGQYFAFLFPFLLLPFAIIQRKKRKKNDAKT